MLFRFKPHYTWQAGHRLKLQQPCGSGDAWLLAGIAEQALEKKQLLIVICAAPADAMRLQTELGLFAPNIKQAVLPDWETLPYDTLSPHPDLVSERLATLYAAQTGQIDVLILSASTALQRLAPTSYLAGNTFFFRQKDRLNIEQLRTQLSVAGYNPVTQVMTAGEYAIRGGLIDIFPTGSVLPYRLDLFDDEIESIKTFDVDNQRSLYPVKEVRLLPGREVPLDEKSRGYFRSRWRERFDGDPSRNSIYRDIGNGVPCGGIEYYLPLFFENTISLFDYFETNREVVVLTHGAVDQAMQNFWNDTRSRYQFLSKDFERPVLSPEELFFSNENFFNIINGLARIQFTDTSGAIVPEPNLVSLPALSINRRADDPLSALRSYVQNARRRILICTPSHGRRETMQQMLAENHMSCQTFERLEDFENSSTALALVTADLHHGFAIVSGDQETAFITENELFSGHVRRQTKRQQERGQHVDALIRDLAELKLNDPVVHQQHGIGRYRGLIEMDLGEGAAEFLHLEYANNANLYVPVAQLHAIARYSGADLESAPLHALGSGQWEKARRKAAQQVHDTAAELLNLYARRAARQGHEFKLNAQDYLAFAENFGFEETTDQAAAIEAVIQDMASGRPMDRLVCGDVGFGKTEVALRAAFVAVMDGKQVVLLAPTTLLAEQHVQTFSDRFADWPVKIVELSRFRSTKEINQSIEQINQGKADIIIGTHKVLSPNIQFSRLGLIIIDEEHRFGVRQKEALKNLRAEVDVLTLTATPIPRTLAMSLEGIRDFSVIATAPQRRLAIKTFVRRENDSVIREAILRELKRGGQVYFLHNEVDTINNRREMLERLVPEARIAIAHGQMPERDLERVMRDFYQQRFNLLLCTTIIETGIDVPTANTILIHRADRFGLAQLHQLRGRVGRSHHQAYAYLLVHNEEGLTKQANKRLEAITMMEELGSGFYLAMHDLEIRGAGEVLGDNQSGELIEVGFQMYNDMLQQAVKALKQGQEPDLMAPLHATVEINLHVPALLPNDYCPDVHERLSLYKRLASSEQMDSLDQLQEELIDRFGKLPEAAQALIQTHRLRILAKSIDIIKLDIDTEQARIQFKAQPNISPAKIIALIQKHRNIQLAGPEKLKITQKMPNIVQKVQCIKDLIKELTY